MTAMEKRFVGDLNALFGDLLDRNELVSLSKRRHDDHLLHGDDLTKTVSVMVQKRRSRDCCRESTKRGYGCSNSK